MTICDHNWEEADHLDVTKQGKNGDVIEWIEKYLCEKCNTIQIDTCRFTNKNQDTIKIVHTRTIPATRHEIGKMFAFIDELCDYLEERLNK